MLGNIRYNVANTNFSTNATKFECHWGGEEHGKLLLGLAGAGVLANLSVAGLIMARKSLRKWSSGLLIHGTIVDGARAGLLVPLALSVLKCQPVTRCSIIDTAFLLLATVSSLNLLTISLSDAPLLPPPMLVPSLLQSAGYYSRSSHSQNKFNSPLYPKGEPISYYSDFYEEDANLLDETTAMPDSPQCVLFGSFMVWFAALTINLGPTFLSGALAAQAEISPRETGCPLVRGPARHIVLNALWAMVNLLCVVLAASHLRKLKKDLTRARLGLLAAAGAGLAGLAGIAGGVQGQGFNNLNSSQGVENHVGTSSSNRLQNHQHHHQTTPGELDSFLRRAQKNGHCHIRTLGSLAVVNLICWVPLYILALISPVGTGAWEDPAPFAYEITLMTAFAHSVIHPLVLLMLHHPLRHGLRGCVWDSCCCICQCFGMELNESEPPSPIHDPDYDHDGVGVKENDIENGGGIGIVNNKKNNRLVPSSSSRQPIHSKTVTVESTLVGFGSRSLESLGHNSDRMKRTTSLKSNQSFGGSSGHIIGRSFSASRMLGDEADGDDEHELPPPPLPPINSAFRKQVSLERAHSQERQSPLMDNRW